MPHKLFAYGTLRLASVQAELFGRSVPTVADELRGFRLGWVTITDEAVIAASGSATHPILRPGLPDDTVSGAYLEVSDEEIARTDAYEVDDYTRIAVTLASGAEAWAYVASADAQATTTSTR